MTKFTMWKKGQKNHSPIISKAHAHLQTMAKTCAKFQKDWYKNCIWNCAHKVPTVCTLSKNFRSGNDKVRKVEKVTKVNARIISKPHLQTMEKTCAKFQKDWYKIV